MHFGGLAIGSLFKNSVGSYSTERIEQLHMNMNSQALQKGDLTVIIVVINTILTVVASDAREMPKK